MKHRSENPRPALDTEARLQTQCIGGVHRLALYILALLLAVSLSSGCTTPDLKPFANATADLHSSFQRAQVDTVATVRTAGAIQEADSLSLELGKRVVATQSLLSYSDALAQIADAGRSGGDQAEKLGNALNGFLGSFSVAGVIPQSFLAGFKSLYGLVAQVRAAKSLGSAIEKADPAIQSIAGILVADLAALDAVIRTAETPIERAIKDRPENREVLDYRKRLEKMRAVLEKGLGEPIDPAKSAQIKDINALIEGTNDRYQPIMSELKNSRDRISLQVAFVNKAKDGVLEWARAHGKLAQSIREGLQPDYRSLVTTIVELRAILSKGDAK